MRTPHNGLSNERCDLLVGAVAVLPTSFFGKWWDRSIAGVSQITAARRWWVVGFHVVKEIIVIIDLRQHSLHEQWICICCRHHIHVVSMSSLLPAHLIRPLTLVLLQLCKVKALLFVLHL